MLIAGRPNSYAHTYSDHDAYARSDAYSYTDAVSNSDAPSAATYRRSNAV